MPESDFSSVIGAAAESLQELKRLCAESKLEWKNDPNSPEGARVINGTGSNMIAVVAEIPMEGGRLHYSGMLTGGRVSLVVIPTDLCKLLFEAGSKSIAARGA